MPLVKSKKRKKSTRMHGRKTYGGGARKKRKKSGHRGGAGMSGSGKRSDHKKTLVTKLYGHDYFGKQGVTSRGTLKDKGKRVNLRDIEANLEKYGKSMAGKWNIEVKDYKILMGPKGYVVQNKLVITAKGASKQAEEQVKKAGGEIVIFGKSKQPKE